jgi:DNA-binding MurR/RpiR family transcriptional regulator
MSKSKQKIVSCVLDDSDWSNFNDMCKTSRSSFLRYIIKKEFNKYQEFKKLKDTEIKEKISRKEDEEIELFNLRISLPVIQDQYGNYIQENVLTDQKT